MHSRHSLTQFGPISRLLPIFDLRTFAAAGFIIVNNEASRE